MKFKKLLPIIFFSLFLVLFVILILGSLPQNIIGTNSINKAFLDDKFLAQNDKEFNNLYNNILTNIARIGVKAIDVKDQNLIDFAKDTDSKLFNIFDVYDNLKSNSLNSSIASKNIFISLMSIFSILSLSLSIVTIPSISNKLAKIKK
ncbi:Uncharacterised protein [Mesomycoplasma conjunctivae]|nr:hypothetical protein [Mesomycoplasma conjunctivae]VEU66191.1 Uncharacterised protein [Mesomycoplasma conjunctivae]